MRALFVLWLTPSALFWSWHLLSMRDILFGREFHDEVFRLYGQLLGIAPSAIPALFAKAVFTDGLLVLAIFLFRKRKAIAAALLRRLPKRAPIMTVDGPAGPGHLAG